MKGHRGGGPKWEGEVGIDGEIIKQRVKGLWQEEGRKMSKELGGR